MSRIKEALFAIQADGGRAAEILQAGIDGGGAVFVAELAAFIVAALDGVVLDPKKL